MKTDQSNRKWIIAAMLVIFAAAIIGYYFLTRPALDTGSVEPSPSVITMTPNTPEATMKEEPSASSPLSPISPISPISPVTPVDNATGGPEVSPEETQRIIDEAIWAQDQGDYDQAIELVNTLLEEDPNNFIALNIRGTAYFENGNIDPALADYNRVIELEPSFPHGYYNRGRTYRFLHRYDEALADLQKSIDLAPNRFGYRAYGNIGLIHHQQGDYEEALAAFEKSISFNKEDNADVYFFRGETYTALEDYEAAIADYQAAIDRFPRYGQAHRSLGYAYYQTGQLDQALESLNQALDISSDSPAAHFYLMLVHLATDNLDQAKTEASRAVSSLPALSAEEQEQLLTRVLSDLETYAQENPAKTDAVEELANLIPPPQ